MDTMKQPENAAYERFHDRPNYHKAEPGRVFPDMYTKDPQTGAFRVEVAVDSYEAIFNEWDPSPYKRRDIAPDLREYLNDCAHDIPLRFPLKLVLSIPAHLVDTDKESHVREGLRNYFAFVTKTIVRRLGRLRREAIVFLAMAATLLICFNLAGGLREKGLIFQLLLDGVQIGTWVFAWEAISAFMFGQRRIKRELVRWRRYLEADIEFIAGQDKSDGRT